MMKTFLCTAAMIAAPVVASATVVGVGDSGTLGATLMPGGTLSFLFEPTQDLDFLFAVTGIGFASSLQSLTFGYSPIASEGTSFTDYLSLGPISVGLGTLEALTSDQPFYVYIFGNSAMTPSSISLAYVTEESLEVPAPVPLPAAGGLLALALAGLGGTAIARRRKEAVGK